MQKKTFLACGLFPIVGHAIIIHRTVSFNSSYARPYVLNTVLGVQSTLPKDGHLWDQYYVSVLEGSPSYRESNKGSKEKQ